MFLNIINILIYHGFLGSDKCFVCFIFYVKVSE